MSATLPPQPWMTAPATRAVLAALSQGAEEGAVVARFVGGCVRDALAGRAVKDIDLATRLQPEEVMRRLEAAGLGVVPTGLAHGTVTALAEHRPFEITTLRRDVETFGRHARVAFTDDWQADAARRDLTINALFCDAEGRLLDFFGGVEDLKAGRVRFVGRARQRIEEDYLRLLRFFRFHAHYGRGAPDAEGLAAAAALAPELARISVERKRDELLKLLAAPDPRPVVAIMQAKGVLPQVLPETRELAVLERLVALAPEGDALLRLGALLPPGPEQAGRAARHLRLSGAQRGRLEILLAPPLAVEALAEPRARDRALYRLGAEKLADLARLAAAEGRLEGPALARLLAAAGAWRAPVLPLAGRDLIVLGVPPGPQVGALLRRLEAWWIEAGFPADRQACLDKARQLLAP